VFEFDGINLCGRWPFLHYLVCSTVPAITAGVPPSVSRCTVRGGYSHAPDAKTLLGFSVCVSFMAIFGKMGVMFPKLF
jgi:hypothetical protein